MTAEEGWDRFSRRLLLQRSSLLAATIALGGLVDAKGLLADADAAITDDLIADCMLGLAAFVLPGNDRYSKSQGMTADGPGAVDSGALATFIRSLDEFLPPPENNLPLSGAASLLLNDYAVRVRPTAVAGQFRTPFSNLTFNEKVEVFRRFEAEAVASTAAPELKFVAGLLPTFAAFVFCSEAGHYDPATHQLHGRPVSWDISGYGGPSDGHAEFKGYFQGRKRALATPGTHGKHPARKHRRRHGRSRRHHTRHHAAA